MALVLKAVERKGVLSRFDVIRAENGGIEDLVVGLESGDYTVLADNNQVVNVSTEYRTVQDITYGGETTTRSDL